MFLRTVVAMLLLAVSMPCATAQGAISEIQAYQMLLGEQHFVNALQRSEIAALRAENEKLKSELDAAKKRGAEKPSEPAPPAADAGQD